jgi:hypothetical protein
MRFQKYVNLLFILLMSLALTACEEEKLYDHTIVVEEVELEQPPPGNIDEFDLWRYITKEDFEAQNGNVITIEGMAVNSKPMSYVYVTSYHIFLIADYQYTFFWPPYLEGKRVRITGRAIVKEEKDLRYAQTTDYVRRYYLEVESWSAVN